MSAAFRSIIAIAVAVTATAALALGAGGAAAQPAPGLTARAASLLPPAGSVFTGTSAGPAGSFASEVGKHPAVYGEFVHWGQSIGFAFTSAAAAHATLMLHLQTYAGTGPEAITPQQIAAGAGDRYLVTLNGLIAHFGKPVYIRLLPEMNQANNPYCAFNPDGSSRGPAFAPSAFVAAWRRVVIIVRGGSVASIDSALASLGQTRLHGLGGGATLASTPVSFVWTPQVAGAPDLPANSPAAYYPGDGYVDWVGTDFYSKFPNFTGLDTFYKQFSQRPFAFGEWAIWGGDNPGFVSQLFAWVNAHHRVRMMLYNQGFNMFSLTADPASSAAIRQQLAPARYLGYTPEWQGAAS